MTEAGDIDALAARMPVVAWLDGVLARQKDSLILWAPFFFAVGVGIYFSLRQEPAPAFSASGLVVGFVFAGFAWVLRRRREDFYGLWLLSLAVLLIAAGFADAQLRTLSRHTVLLAHAVDRAQVEATVVEDDPLSPGEGAQLLLDDVHIRGMTVAGTPQRLRLRIRDGDAMPAPGDRISVLAGLSPPAPPNAPGAFDFQRYAWFRRIGGFGFAFRPPEIVQARPAGGMAQQLATLRAGFIRRLDAVIPYPESALAETLAAGARASIAPADEAAMRAAGLAHMLVIAGLHIGIVGGIVFFTARFLMALVPALALRHPIKKYAAVAAFAVAFAYAIVTGASVPTLRALLMSAVVLLAILTDRVAFSPRLLALAALAILTAMPEALIGPSFQLSFAAVAGLIIIYDRLRTRWSNWFGAGGLPRRAGLYLAGIILTTIIASAFTAPYAIYQFQNFAPYGVIGNLLAIPVLSYAVMPLLMLGTLLLPFHLERIPWTLAGRGLHLILGIAHRVNALPQATLLVPAMPVSVLVLITFGGAIALFWRGRGGWLSLIFFAAATLMALQADRPDILVSGDARLLAVRDGGTYWLSSRVVDRYAGRDWRQSLGDADAAHRWPREGPMLNSAMTCGEGGCHWEKDGRKVAFSSAPWTQISDCAWADILIAQQPVTVKNCNAGTIIDRFDVWRDGATSLWLDGRIESVNDLRGERPWCVGQAPRH